ncbi:hypothetical protein LAZ67_7001038 [Cordylochernes scorpioides]|uniref:Uncharacterized protein n=1 Tax=Cordylochernes scorpioides TaxID=51811 RepID=A0ABY6KLX3_9ARAC|nr:hypothetical protein LAZ67_7001038 [Cordylochernes scorpioides]
MLFNAVHSVIYRLQAMSLGTLECIGSKKEDLYKYPKTIAEEITASNLHDLMAPYPLKQTLKPDAILSPSPQTGGFGSVTELQHQLQQTEKRPSRKHGFGLIALVSLERTLFNDIQGIDELGHFHVAGEYSLSVDPKRVSSLHNSIYSAKMF